MYCVIVGHSEFACELAKVIFNENENKVVMIVKKKEEAVRVTAELEINVINADATKPETLDDLELHKCDVFIAAADLEKDNVLTAMYAKEAGAKKIFVKVENEDAESILKRLGFFPINAQRFAAHSVELMITRPAVSELVNIGTGEFDIIEVPVSETNLLGKEVGVTRGKNFNVLATYSSGKYDFSKETKILQEDKVILIVTAGKEKAAEKEYSKGLKGRLGLIQ